MCLAYVQVSVYQDIVIKYFNKMIKLHTLQVKQTFHPKFLTIIWHKTGGRNDLVGDTQSPNVFLQIISTNEINITQGWL